MPDLSWNASIWGSIYSWPDSGEEWSSAWGGSESQWFGSILPRLHRFLPTRRILEIAPGFGRWTKFLIPACDEFIGIDFSEKCVDACRSRFAAAKHARFFDNDGHSLAAAPDDSFDLIFSFDSLVHAECDVLQSYVPQILRKLSSTGVAFIHHSNLLAYKDRISNPHSRAETVSADTVADLIKCSDGTVFIQELTNWGGEHLIDCFTLFARRENHPSAKPVRLENALFMEEAKIIQRFQSHYSALPGERRAHETKAFPALAAVSRIFSRFTQLKYGW